MFWTRKDKKDKRTNPSDKKDKSCAGGSSQGKSRSESIRKEALAHARTAREQIGEDTLNKVAEMMQNMNKNAAVQAKAAADKDPDKALDEVLAMMRMRD